MQAFNPLTLPLSGLTLIEASAGTGKTYGIGSLFLRLLLLENQSVEHLLILTFTKAATAELKLRLRFRLSQISRQMHDMDEHYQFDRLPADLQPDDFTQQLFKKLQEQNRSVSSVKQRIAVALDEFDRVGIYTIHSFCRSVLSDEAFLCGMPFQIQIEEQSDEKMVRQLADDFWRTYIAQNRIFAELFGTNYVSKNGLDHIKKYLHEDNLYTEILSIDAIKNNLGKASLRFAREKQAFEMIFPDLQTAFWGAFEKKINQRFFKKPSYEKIFSQWNHPSSAPKLIQLGEAEPKKKTTFSDKERELFQAGARWGEALESFQKHQESAKNNILLTMRDFIAGGIRNAKATHNRRTFNDFLIDVRNALKKPNSPLAKRLSQAWKAVLIDEFQDTDAVQFDIFERAFFQQGVPIYCVGDPKQSIYRFRGADPKTYQKAQKIAAHQCFTMDTNYRTHQQLVENINHLFSVDNPFEQNYIHFQPVKAHREHSRFSPVLPAVSAFSISSSENVGQQRQEAAKICAHHLADLLNRRDFLHDNKPFNASKVAILINRRADAGFIQKALADCNIYSVSVENESIFSAPEARALANLLRFWREPHQTAWLRNILGDVLFKFSAKQIALCTKSQLNHLIFAASAAHKKWQTSGIFAAYQLFATKTLLEDGLIKRRQMRTLSNITQLLELIESAQCAGQTEQIQWLNNAINHAQQTDTPASERKFRLDNDESLVKIMTIHTSKGLEFPLVYCPFIAIPTSPQSYKFEKVSNEHDQYQLVGTKELTATQKQEITEYNQGEQARLLYVALTRASDALVLCIPDGPFNLNTAFHRLLSTKGSSPAEGAHAWLKQSGGSLMHQLPPQTRFENTPQTTENLRAAFLTRSKFNAMRRSSFTAWLSQSKYERLSVDFQRVQKMDENQYSVHHFPAGTRYGLCWHAILEKLDFSREISQQRAVIDEKLTQYGLSPEEWTQTIQTAVENLCAVPLYQSITPSHIKRQERLSESGFLTDNIHFRPQTILEILGDDWSDEIKNSLKNQINNTTFAMFGGFIDWLARDQNGEIYIVDYKSNRLGKNDDDYSDAHIQHAMAQHQYVVQATLYALACYRYLKVRKINPKTLHVRYLFLRGLKAGTTQGVWQWDVDCEKLEQLNQQLYS